MKYIVQTYTDNPRSPVATIRNWITLETHPLKRDAVKSMAYFAEAFPAKQFRVIGLDKLRAALVQENRAAFRKDHPLLLTLGA
jgi:hypothetical protein